MATEHDPNTTSAAPAASTSVTRRTSRRAVLAAGALASGAALGASLETSSIRTIGLNTALAGTLVPQGGNLADKCSFQVVLAEISNESTAVADQYLTGTFKIFQFGPSGAGCQANEECVVTRVIVTLETGSTSFSGVSCGTFSGAFISKQIIDESCEGSDTCSGTELDTDPQRRFPCLPDDGIENRGTFGFKILASPAKPLVAGNSARITVQIYFGPTGSTPPYNNDPECDAFIIPSI